MTFFLEGVPVYQRRSESHYRGIVIPWDDPDPAQRVIEGLEARAKAEDEEERVKDDTSFYPNYKTLRRDLEAAERVPLVYAGVVIDWNAPDPVMMLLRELQARGLTRPYPPDLAPEPEGKVWKEAFSRCLTQYGDATDGSILKGRR